MGTMKHGDHWQAVEQNKEEFIDIMIPLICKEGKPAGEHPFSHVLENVEQKEGVVFGLQYPDPDSPVSFLALGVRGITEGVDELWTAYPVCAEGPVSRLSVCDVRPADNGIEGTVEVYLPEGDTVFFYDPFFFLNRQNYVYNEEIEVALSALAYNMECFQFDASEIAERTESEEMNRRWIAEGRFVDAKTVITLPFYPERAADYTPFDGAEDSGTIEIYIEEAVPLACVGRLFWRLTGVIMRAANIEIRIDVYAAEQVLGGYLPKAGDNVAAAVWIQGRLKSRVGPVKQS
jgi:hypothetical protein